ncbi:MAG: choice-of-anchor B family protein [Flavobacteriales bacterium]|nr:choice-of-anchor B family protein [Flavobacteriales bacterium]
MKILERPAIMVAKCGAFALASLIANSTMSQDSLNVRRLFHWDDPSIPMGVEVYFNQYNDVWGYAANGREYAFLGSTLGVHVFDVTEPASSVLVDHVPGAFSGTGVIHRDYKVYQGHLFATCDQGPSTLQVMDLQYLPDSVHVVYDSPALFARAHNIQIDTVNARMYTCGGSTEFSVYDISDPANPALLSNCEADVPWWGNVVGYVHDCFVRDNIVWTNDQDGMHVLDFTDAANPALLGSLTNYPDQGYNHSSWMNDAGTLLAMADETHGSPLKFVDATNLSDLQVIATVTSGVDPTSVLHNPFFVGDMVHVAYYYDGYWLWNLADPQQPILLGYFDTCLEPNTNSYSGAWGTYPFLPSGHVLVSDMQTGLWVLDVDQATGVATPATDAFRIHPTITNGLVNIQCLLNETGASRIEVIDAKGALVMTTGMNSTTSLLDLSRLDDGLYIVRVSGAATHTQRIVKNAAR